MINTNTHTTVYSNAVVKMNGKYINYLCPDLLVYEQIGAADGLRGRVVRGFFYLMRFWPTKKSDSVG